MASRHDQAPRLTPQQPDVDVTTVTATQQKEGIHVVDARKLRDARGNLDHEIEQDDDEPTEIGIQAIPMDEVVEVEELSIHDSFPEIAGFDAASGILSLQDGSSIAMNELPGLPVCTVEVEVSDDRHAELRISYGENYNLLLSRRIASGVKKGVPTGEAGHIDMIADLGRGSRKMVNETGNAFGLREGIEQFKVRVFEHFVQAS